MSIKNLNVINGGGLIGNTTVDGLNIHNLDLVNYNILKLSASSVIINGIEYPGTDGAYGNVLVTDGNGKLQFVTPPSAPVTSVNTKTGDVVLTTSDISEGTNLYYTNARVDARIQTAKLGDLSDVNVSGVATNNILRYDGTNWSKSTLGGSAYYIPRYKNSSEIEDSIIYNDITNSRIGISTTTPTDKLQISGGNLAIYDSANDRSLYIGKDSTARTDIKYDTTNNNVVITSHNSSSNGGMKFIVGNSATAITIDSSTNIETGGTFHVGGTKIGFKTNTGGQNDLITLKEYTTSTNDVSIDTTGTLLVGSGSSASTYYDTNVSTIKNDGALYLTSNNSIKLVTDLENTSKTIEINASGQIVSSITTTAPFSVSSTLLVSNLNSDLLDGKHANEFLQTNNKGTAGQTITFGDGLRTGFINFNQYDNYDPDDVVNTGGGAGIINDSSAYKALMIFGNKSNDNTNKVIKLYDDVNVNRKLNVTNNASIGGTLSVTGNTSLGGTLSVTSTSTLNGDTSIGSNLNVSGTTTITGAATLSNTLAVTNKTTLSDTLILSYLTGSDTRMLTVNASGEVGTSGMPEQRRDLYLLTPIHFPYVDGTYSIDVYTETVDSTTIKINVTIIPDNNSYTIYYGRKDSTNRTRTVTSNISQSQYTSSSNNLYGVMHVFADYGGAVGSDLTYGQSSDDFNEDRYVLATIKIRNAYNSNGEILDVINWSKLNLNAPKEIIEWDSGTAGTGNLGDMVVSNGDKDIMPVPQVRWENNYLHVIDSRFIVDKRIGLNTDSPTAELSINNMGENNDVKLLSFSKNNSNQFVFKGYFNYDLSHSEKIVLGSDWTNMESHIMTWENNGNVGISILDPGYKLEVGGTTRTHGNSYVDGHIWAYNPIHARDFVEVKDTTGAEGFKMQWNDDDKSIDFIIN